MCECKLIKISKSISDPEVHQQLHSFYVTKTFLFSCQIEEIEECSSDPSNPLKILCPL